MAEARGFAGDGILKRTGETPHLRQILCATKSDKLSVDGLGGNAFPAMMPAYSPSWTTNSSYHWARRVQRVFA
jgi:hypothetical protein